MVRGARRASLTLLGCGVPLAFLPGCGSVDALSPVTLQGRSITGFFWLVMIPSTLVFLLVAGLLAYVLVRFRGRPGDPEPPQVHGNRRLEIIWTIIPHLLLAILFVGMIRTMQTVNAESPSALRVQVIGHQWWWEYRYPDLGVVTANELHLPVGTGARLEIGAADVVHSFWVPQVGWKVDAVPNKTNTMSVLLDKAGLYDGACTEYCGTQHAWMRNRLVAEPRDQFDAWVQAQRAPAAVPTAAGAIRGRSVFLGNTCVSCHAIRGTADAAQVGPDLTHLGGRSIIGAGVLGNTPDNLRRWIRDAQAVKPGVLMPAYASLSDDDLAALVEYLEGLK